MHLNNKFILLLFLIILNIIFSFAPAIEPVQNIEVRSINETLLPSPVPGLVHSVVSNQESSAEPDFGPYMRELQRRIKMNWDPPKGNDAKRVILLFKISKSGRLLSCNVLKSSGIKKVDNAALEAVFYASPFRPLPVEFKGESIDVKFVFDYNVFGATFLTN